MKKMFAVLFAMILLSSAFSTHAFEFIAGEEVDIVQVVEGDLYSAGARTDIKSEVLGDIVIAAGEINIDATVSQDAILAGGDIVISQQIGDDVRVAGGNIRIQADILGDLIVFGGNIKLTEGATIHGDILAYAGQLTLDGDVLGDLNMEGGKLVINGIVGGDAYLEVEDFKSISGIGSIKGNLEYSHKEELSVLESLAKGEISFEKESSEKMGKKILGFALGYYVFKIIGVFVLASLLYFFFEKIFHKVGEKLMSEKGKSFTYGLILILVTPIVIVLLCITIIGIPVALFTLFLYVFMFVFAKVLNVAVLNSILVEKYKLEALWKKLLVIFGLTFLFCSFGIISIIASLFTLGALLMYKIDLIQNLRK